MENGEWRMENGEWRMESGEYEASENKNKIGLLKLAYKHNLILINKK